MDMTAFREPQGPESGRRAEKTWREKKAEAEAITKSLLRRIFVVKPEFLIPGSKFKTLDGREYQTDKNGSRRRVR
jgi:hypothetical protein